MKNYIKILKAECGDAIVIHYIGNDGKPHNIFIDSGYSITYIEQVKPEIERIIQDGEKIDLWIITHIDDDHIGGIIDFIKDDDYDIDLVNQFWFNWSQYGYTIPKDDGFVNVEQGKDLREYLKSINKLSQDDITNETEPINLFGAIFTILSPNKKSLQKLKKVWGAKEKIKVISENNILVSNCAYDNDIKLEVLAKNKFTQDSSPPNGSSIAFTLTIEETSFLFLGDSFPKVITSSLKDNPVEIDYVKLSHHGSKKNTNEKLISLINCKNYIISCDGENKHCLPNKETFAKIILNKNNKDKLLNFYFNYKNERLVNMFLEDDAKNINSIFLDDLEENKIKF
ncbi:MAG: MBL fold metallo-hydrolase [Bacteroidetes bacterium]|nr:MBL fold metallo-hydrolase [Bacteroidota bacterium]